MCVRAHVLHTDTDVGGYATLNTNRTDGGEADRRGQMNAAW